MNESKDKLNAERRQPFIAVDDGLMGARPAWIVVIFALFVGLAGLWSLPPLDRDEARFAQATAQMLETGDLVTIRFQERERNKKPVGIHWLQAASVATFSNVEAREIWAYRLPSVIGVILAALFTYQAATKLFDTRTGLLAGLLLASAPVVAAEANIAKTDAMLLAMICLAQLMFISIYADHHQNRKTRWHTSVLFWTAQGAAILIKGPIGPLISVLTGLSVATAKPRLRWMKRFRPIVGLIILILMITPWASAIWSATDGRFFADALGGDMLGKVGDAQEGHVGLPGYHAVLVFLLFWPAAALILPALIHAWGKRHDWRIRVLLAWLIPGWILFELAATKLPHYVLPLYPALAIIAAHYACSPIKEGWPKKISVVLFALVGLIVAGAIAFLSLQMNGAATITGFIGATLIAIGTAATTYLFWRGQAFKGGLAASLLSAIFAWIMLTGILPNLSPLAISPRLSAALETTDRHPIHDNQLPVALAGYSEPSAVFLLGTQTLLTNAENAATQLQNGAISAAIIEARHHQAFNAALNGHSVTSIAVIDGLNYSNGDEVSLTIYVTAP